MHRTDPYSPVRGKCVWWREIPNSEDLYETQLKESERRIDCSCFVEGFQWEFVALEVPIECPMSRSCRYYVKSW